MTRPDSNIARLSVHTAWALVLALLAGLGLMTPSARAVGPGGEIEDTGWRRLAAGVHWRHVRLTRPAGLFPASLRVYRFDPAHFDLRVVRFSSPATARQALRGTTRAVAAINANFFNPRGRPLGLVIAQGRVVYRMRRINSGVLWSGRGRGGISHASRFLAQGVRTAIQAWPRLMAGGRPTRGVKNPGRRHRRSLAGVDRAGRLLLAVTEGLTGGLSLREVQTIFDLPGFNVRDLLNLDGGRSTQLSVRVGGHDYHLSGFDSVPVLLAVIKRPASTGWRRGR
ncbi:MAG: phosphodiester glycosidase family protein [Proteobacteria bacterium]|nr:phosphodiester glycosidase family protein [Pseudomonadota bacterium]